MHFGDEKAFEIDNPTFRPRFWCDIRDQVPELQRRGQHQARVAVFGCFSLDKVPNLVFIGPSYSSASYCDALTLTLRRNDTLVHDRHPVHTSKTTAAHAKKKRVRLVLLRPKSADINPIENVWGLVARQVYMGSKVYHTVASLVDAIKGAWSLIQAGSGLRAKLVGSMPRRLAQVISKKGALTKY